MLLAIPPADGYGDRRACRSAGIGPTDTLLFVIDVKPTPSTLLRRATGTAVPPKAGLPTVKLDKQGASRRSPSRSGKPRPTWSSSR